MSDNKQLSLVDSEAKWLKLQAEGGVGLNRPTSLTGLIDQPIKLSNVTFRVRELAGLKARLSVHESDTRSLANFDYYSHTLKYFDDYSTKFENLAISFDELVYTKDDVEEVKQFMAKQRVLVYDEGTTPPDMAEIGLFYRRAPLAGYRVTLPKINPPVMELLPQRQQYRIGCWASYSIDDAVQWVPQLVPSPSFVYVEESVLPVKLTRLECGYGGSYLKVAMPMGVLTQLEQYQPEDRSARHYLSECSGQKVVVLTGFPGYDIDEIEQRLLTPDGILEVDPQGPELASMVGAMPLRNDYSKRGDAYENVVEWMQGPGRSIDHIHELLGCGNDARWMLNIGGEKDSEMSKARKGEEDERDQYLSLALSLSSLERRERYYMTDAQSEEEQRKSLVMFLIYSGAPNFRDRDAEFWPPKRGNDSLHSRLGDRVNPHIPHGKAMHMQHYKAKPDRYSTPQHMRLVVLGTTRECLATLSIRAATTWVVYFRHLMKLFSDTHEHVMENTDVEGNPTLELAISQLATIIDYLESVMDPAHWRDMSEKQAYLECHAIRNRIGQFFINEDDQCLFYGLLGVMDLTSRYTRAEIKVTSIPPDHIDYYMMLEGKPIGCDTFYCLFNRTAADLSDAPPRWVAPTKSAPEIAQPVEQDSWVDKIIDYFRR